MPDFTSDGQPERPERVRQQQIAAVRDPEKRAELEALVKSRNEARQPELDRQSRERDKDVDAAYKKIIAKSTAHPPPAPRGFQQKPILDKAAAARAMVDAKAQVIDRYADNIRAIDKPFNRQIDQRLDIEHGPYEPNRQREAQRQEFQKTRETLTYKTDQPREAPAKSSPEAQEHQAFAENRRDVTGVAKTGGASSSPPPAKPETKKEKDFSAAKREVLTYKKSDDRDR